MWEQLVNTRLLVKVKFDIVIPVMHRNRQRHNSDFPAILQSSLVHNCLLRRSNYVAEVFASLCQLLPAYLWHIYQEVIIYTSNTTRNRHSVKKFSFCQLLAKKAGTNRLRLRCSPSSLQLLSMEHWSQTQRIWLCTFGGQSWYKVLRSKAMKLLR